MGQIYNTSINIDDLIQPTVYHAFKHGQYQRIEGYSRSIVPNNCHYYCDGEWFHRVLDRSQKIAEASVPKQYLAMMLIV